MLSFCKSLSFVSTTHRATNAFYKKLKYNLQINSYKISNIKKLKMFSKTSLPSQTQNI